MGFGCQRTLLTRRSTLARRMLFLWFSWRRTGPSSVLSESSNYEYWIDKYDLRYIYGRGIVQTSASTCQTTVPTKFLSWWNASLRIETALKLCSFVMYLKAFPVFMFKSMNLVFCVLSEKEIGEWGEETAKVLCSQDFPYLLEGRVWLSRSCPKDRRCWGVARQEGVCKSRGSISYSIRYSFRLFFFNFLKFR